MIVNGLTFDANDIVNILDGTLCRGRDNPFVRHVPQIVGNSLITREIFLCANEYWCVCFRDGSPYEAYFVSTAPYKVQGAAASSWLVN